MHIADINQKLSSLAWTSANGNRASDDVRVYPKSCEDVELIGSFSRFAEDAQRFEVLYQDGQIVVRPLLPEARKTGKSLREYIEEDPGILKAA